MTNETLSELKLVLRATHTDALSYVLSKQPAISARGAWYFPPVSARTAACLVAHLDTVWDRDRETVPPRLFADRDAGVLWSPDGLGADDRAGLVSVFLVRARTGCAVLVCDGEERGGWGAKSACQHPPLAAAMLRHKLLVELDRHGTQHFVCYAGEPAGFRRWIRAVTGWTEQPGAFSDVAILADRLRIPACNLATGYAYEHSHREMLRLDRWKESISAATALVCATPPATFGEWRRSCRTHWSEEGEGYYERDAERMDYRKPRRNRRPYYRLWSGLNRQSEDALDSESP